VLLGEAIAFHQLVEQGRAGLEAGLLDTGVGFQVGLHEGVVLLDVAGGAGAMVLVGVRTHAPVLALGHLLVLGGIVVAMRAVHRGMATLGMEVLDVLVAGITLLGIHRLIGGALAAPSGGSCGLGISTAACTPKANSAAASPTPFDSTCLIYSWSISLKILDLAARKTLKNARANRVC
jgi:hypothetical protein